MEPHLLDLQSSSDDPRGAPASSILVALARWRWLVLSAVLAGAGIGMAVGIVQPNTYRSTGKLLVRWGAREEVTPEAVIVGRGSGSWAQPRDVVNDELQLLRDPQVFERVAREVTPQRIFAPYDPRTDDDEETPPLKRMFHRMQGWWFQSTGADAAGESGHPIDACSKCVTIAAHALMKDITVEGEAYTSVITVSYAAHDPALAMQVVSALLDSAEQRHHEVYSTDPTLEFLSQRVQDSRAEMQEAEKAFNELRVERNIPDFESRCTELLTTVRELEVQVAEDASRLADVRSRSASLTALLAEVPKTSVQHVDRAPIVNPRWSVLQQMVFNLQGSLVDLNAQLGGTKAVREAERVQIEKRIEALLGELKDVPELIERTTVEQTTANPRYERLREQLDDVLLENSAQESVAALRAHRFEQARSDLKATEASGALYAELETRALAARARYEDFEEAHRSTSLIKLLDGMDYSNLRRIQEAALPIEKEGPRRGKLVIVGLLLGVFSGLALAFGCNRFDPYLRTPADVEHLLGTRIVDVVPRSRPPQRLHWPSRRAAL